jgi:chromosomal replication initiator protein
MDRVWENVLDVVEEKIGKTNTETWLKPTRPIGLRGDIFHLEVPSPLFREWLLNNLLGPLEASLASVLGHTAHVAIQVNSSKQQGELFPQNERGEQTAQHGQEGESDAQGETDETDEEADNTLAQPQGARSKTKSRQTKKNGLVQSFTFSSFVVGGGNQFAHAAAQAVSDHPGSHYNPLFIYGGVGLGKTHLINAIGHQTLVKKGKSNVFYLSSESFTNELISHIRRDRMDDFKNKFRKADVLIVDDIQFLSGRERTQEEFFHTFNTLHEARKQIILTSDKFPNEIQGLEERLRNRFESGLIADIQPPDLETRIAILQKKALAKKIQIPPDVAMFIASNVTANVRELEGGLTRLGALAEINDTAITVDFARQVLHNLAKDKGPDITIEMVQRAVAKYFGLRVADLNSKKRTQPVAFPRQVAMYLCRKLANTSYPMIGIRFGGKNHTTALYACSTIEKRLKRDEELQSILDRIESTIYSQRVKDE